MRDASLEELLKKEATHLLREMVLPRSFMLYAAVLKILVTPPLLEGGTELF